tara:strand:- start:691 stop:1320 length:630 start_codon:yes stop_codon:yes gene_type:complete
MATGNSQEVAYGFGQLGSAHVKTATPLVPPKGMVIVAIQFLAANTLSKLVSESDRAGLPNYIDTETEGNMNYNGYHESNVTNGTYAAGAAITVTANTDIQIGDPVLLITQASTKDLGITIDSETPVPNYEKYNSYVKVESVNAAGTSITLSHQITPSSQSLVFLGGANGAGGNDASSILYPQGMIMYGRWTEVTPAADADGGLICYFGY